MINSGCLGVPIQTWKLIQAPQNWQCASLVKERPTAPPRCLHEQRGPSAARLEQLAWQAGAVTPAWGEAT